VSIEPSVPQHSIFVNGMFVESNEKLKQLKIVMFGAFWSVKVYLSVELG
jgi:hypothetical protein